MNKLILSITVLLIFSFSPLKEKREFLISKKLEKQIAVIKTPKVLDENDELLAVYNSLNKNGFSLPNSNFFITALNGFYNLKEKGVFNKNILTIINFDLPSTEKRLWVIDLELNEILFHTYVAHGKNSGELFATSFSNENESYKSSLGFYTTGEIYTGSNGLSLKLDGLEKGINDKARERAVVIHGADYVSRDFINSNQKLGRSHGCPALPVELNEKIIRKICNKSCLFIYKSDNSKYKNSSKLVS